MRCHFVHLREATYTCTRCGRDYDCPLEVHSADKLARGCRNPNGVSIITGLGDVIAAVLGALGIKPKRKKGQGCACEERREWLNGILPFNASPERE